MKSLKSFCKWTCQRWVINLIVVSLLTLLIGGFGQYLGIANHQPMGSPLAKGVIIALLWLVYAGCFLRLKPVSASLITTLPEQNSVDVSQAIFAQSLTKVLAEINQTTIKPLPTLLILGAEGAGKNSLLQQVELDLDAGQPLIQQNLAKTHLDLKLGENTLFLVAASRFVKEQPEIEQAWQSLSHLMKPLIKKSLQAVVITYNLVDLLQKSDAQLNREIQIFRQRIKALQDVLGYYLPIYLVITHTDRLTGFNEFFAHLTVAEKQQAWGIALQDSLNFTEQYQELLSLLDQQLLHCLHQISDENARILAAEFPLQMLSLKTRLAVLVQHLVQPNKYTNSLKVKGLYFTSALQQGEPVDYLMGQLAKKLDLKQLPPVKEAYSHKPYFIQQLFNEVLLTRNTTAMPTQQVIMRQKRWILLSYAMLGGMALIVSLILYKGYQTNKYQLKALADDLKNYQQIAKAGEVNAALQQLEQTAHLLVSQHSWLNQIGFQQVNKATKVYGAAYQQQLQAILLPALLAVLEKTLQDDLQQPNRLYRTLKAYLMFANPGYMQADYIQDWFKHFLYQGLGKHTPQTLILQNAIAVLTAKPLPAQTLNEVLISQARQVINTATPAQRTYNVLQQQSLVIQQPAVNLDGSTIAGFEQLFNLSNSANKVPGFYTLAGYQQAYLQVNDKIAQETQVDNWILGDAPNTILSDTALREQIQALYFTDYVAYWEATLNLAQLKQFTQLKQAADGIKLMASPASPLRQLLLLAVQNTYIDTKNPANGAKVFNNAVSPYFVTIRQFMQADAKQIASMLHLQQQLQILYSYLSGILSASNVQQACFSAAKMLVKQDPANPLVILQQQADQYPQPIQAWVNDLVNQVAGLIFNEAKGYLNQQWQQQVYLPYSQGVQHHYPFGFPSQTEVTPTDFINFFGQQGILTRFFASYLQDFVITSGTSWQLRKFAGQHLILKPYDLNALQQANDFMQLFFTADGKLGWHFNLMPVTMSPQIVEAQLSIGNRRLIYRHDPQLPTEINWPTDNQRISLQLVDLNGNRNNINFLGNWGVLKWLQTCKIQQQSATQYLAKCTLNEHTISYDIQADSVNNPFNQLATMATWSLPGKL